MGIRGLPAQALLRILVICVLATTAVLPLVGCGVPRVFLIVIFDASASFNGKEAPLRPLAETLVARLAARLDRGRDQVVLLRMSSDVTVAYDGDPSKKNLLGVLHAYGRWETVEAGTATGKALRMAIELARGAAGPGTRPIILLLSDLADERVSTPGDNLDPSALPGLLSGLPDSVPLVVGLAKPARLAPIRAAMRADAQLYAFTPAEAEVGDTVLHRIRDLCGR